MLLKTDIALAYTLQQARISKKEGWIVRDFFTKFRPSGNHIEIFSGVRRCGKSTLLKQMMTGLHEPYAWFSFEDARIHGFSVEDFPKLDEVIGDDCKVYFFDEIQNVPSWEVYVRALHDSGKKVYITGSNASLLSKELGTRLTGRHLIHKLYPFSYTEYLRIRQEVSGYSTFSEYLMKGGFPEFLDTANPEVLQELVKDIVYRDVAIRYSIRNTDILTDIVMYLLSNIGKEFTYNSLRKAFAMGSAATVSDYLSWLEDSYLFFYLARFNWSAKNQKINPRKVYAIDNGLVHSNSLSFSSDSGRLLENVTFLHLLQQKMRLYYFREERECDFVVFDRNKCILLLQVCEHLTSDNQKRELEGLSEAMSFFKKDVGYILTLHQEDKLTVGSGHVYVIPAYRFFSSDISGLIEPMK
jgi:predicted AAA+ superfamily ATPase